MVNIVKRGSRSLDVAYQRRVPEGTKESIVGYSQNIGLVPLFVHQHTIIRALNLKVKKTSKTGTSTNASTSSNSNCQLKIQIGFIRKVCYTIRLFQVQIFVCNQPFFLLLIVIEKNLLTVNMYALLVVQLPCNVLSHI